MDGNVAGALIMIGGTAFTLSVGWLVKQLMRLAEKMAALDARVTSLEAAK